ncbi:MAG: phosphoribosylanthranilate isomerase [Elainellaceae cyanobacterium]
MRVKICGITQINQGQAIAQLGATALGFICAHSSPRYVEASKIRQIVDALPLNETSSLPRIDRVGVFVDVSIDHIVDVVTQGRLSAVQLHGQESVEFCRTLRTALQSSQDSTQASIKFRTPDSLHAPIEIIKAFRVRSPETLADTHRYSDVVDTLLLDAYHPTMVGGTGKTLNWKALQSFRPDCPWLLAGGLTPDNVVEALSQLQPDGIDLSSGVERSPGEKDLPLVKRLLDQLKLL